VDVRHRGAQLVAGTVVVVLATLLTLLASGGATGADAERCARFATQSQIRERLVTGHGERIAVIGDSYSVGLGLRDPETSWPSRLPGRTQVFGFSGSGFSRHASPCRHVAYAARAARALKSAPGLVVVEGGLNDYDQPASHVRAGFRSLMRTLRGRRVLVVGPPAAPARASGAAQVDGILREESDRAGVSYLSMLDAHFSYLDDQLHLTPAGQRAFGQFVADAVSR
jgi:acyl-CoA thioesterase-1